MCPVPPRCHPVTVTDTAEADLTEPVVAVSSPDYRHDKEEEVSPAAVPAAMTSSGCQHAGEEEEVTAAVTTVAAMTSPGCRRGGEEDVTAAGWRCRRKHVFVLSEAGKPIYSRHGNEEALAATMGVMMALVSFIQSGGNAIRAICSGKGGVNSKEVGWGTPKPPHPHPLL